MSKNKLNWVAALNALLVGTVLTCTGCDEPKGGAARVGENIDKGVQDAKDAINPPGPVEKVGRSVDKALKP